MPGDVGELLANTQGLVVKAVILELEGSDTDRLASNGVEMVTGAKRVNFPKPGATKQKEMVTMIDAERMLVHYNQDHPGLKKPAQRITSKIVNHTGKLAVEAGWAGASVAKNAIDGHTAGMVLLRFKKTTITPDVLDVEVVPPKALKG